MSPNKHRNQELYCWNKETPDEWSAAPSRAGALHLDEGGVSSSVGLWGMQNNCCLRESIWTLDLSNKDYSSGKRGSGTESRLCESTKVWNTLKRMCWCDKSGLIVLDGDTFGSWSYRKSFEICGHASFCVKKRMLSYHWRQLAIGRHTVATSTRHGGCWLWKHHVWTVQCLSCGVFLCFRLFWVFNCPCLPFRTSYKLSYGCVKRVLMVLV